MKKTYINPQVQIVKVALEGRLMEGSPYDISDTVIDADAAVKNAGTTSTPAYNVWDDDWSKN